MSELRIRTSWWVFGCTLLGCAGRSTGDDGDTVVGMGGAASNTSAGGMWGTGGLGEGGDGNESGESTTGVGGGPSVTSGGSPMSAGGAPSIGGQSASDSTGAVEGGTGGNASDDELCDWGSYDTDQTDDKLTCKEWTQCQPGEYLADEGGFWDDSICEPCPPGTVTEAVNERRCREWHWCEFGEEVVAEPTPTSDRQCAPSELFPPFPGRALGLLLNNNGPELMVMQNATFVASYSLGGQIFGEVTVSPGVKDGIDDQALDFALLSGARFVVGVATSEFGSPGYVRKVADNGTIEWETPLGSASDWFSAAGIAAGGGALYVVALRNEGTEDSAVELYVLDPANGLLSNPPLEGDPVGSPIDVEVATNGHIYVAGVIKAASGVSGGTTVLEFDPTGGLIAETTVAGSRLLIQLAADDSGGVHALGGTWGGYPGWYFAHHLGSGGARLAEAVLTDGDLWQMDALTSTPAGVLAIGRTPEHPVLVIADADGQITSKEVLEDMAAPERFVGIRQALDGTVFVAGTNVSPLGDQVAFVAPWPK